MHLGMRIIFDTAFFFHPEKYIMFKRPATFCCISYFMFTIDILFSKWDCCCLYSVNGVRKCVTWVLLIYRYLSSFFYIPWYIHCLIECFHSRGQHLCKFIGTKESVCIRKEFNSHRTRLGHQHGRRFIVLGHQHGRRDVMWKHSIHLIVFSFFHMRLRFWYSGNPILLYWH